MPILGWAVESRVYAEDPFRSFLPSIGCLTSYAEPSGEAVRVDTGVTEGSEISMFYDPMISKLCTHGADRAEAIERMNGALDSYLIAGLQHNLPFLREVCRHPKFLSGEITTKFIEEEYPDGFDGVVLEPEEDRVVKMELTELGEDTCTVALSSGAWVHTGSRSERVVERTALLGGFP